MRMQSLCVLPLYKGDKRQLQPDLRNVYFLTSFMPREEKFLLEQKEVFCGRMNSVSAGVIALPLHHGTNRWVDIKENICLFGQSISWHCSLVLHPGGRQGLFYHSSNLTHYFPNILTFNIYF